MQKLCNKLQRLNFLPRWCVSQKLQKYIKFTSFSLKTDSHFSPLSYFFSHKVTPGKHYILVYLRCPTLIQKLVYKNILLFCSWFNIFIVNVSSFARILLVEIKKFELSYLHKKLSYTNSFR